MAGSIASFLALLSLGVILKFGTTLDLVVCLSLGVFRKQAVFLDFVDKYINGVTVIKTLAAGAALLTLVPLLRFFISLTQFSSSPNGFPAKPMFFPCRTNHVRMFPTKHTFSYSYLMVGIPVGWKGSTGGMLSADVENEPASWYEKWPSLKPSSSWFTVNGDDYFERGHLKGGLETKLRNYLRTQGVDPSEFAYAYLFTAARFLNYASNPVSIWNLYSSTKELTATILEVNNTFDERHSYFLRPEPSQVEDTKTPKFSKSWPKDFYVSVFNSRAGSYSISTNDAIYPYMSGPGSINTNITLSSSSGSPKLIARLFSTEPGIDPSTMSAVQKFNFLAKWWWVGLATFFPRTAFQAVFILIRKKVPWSFRPEPRRNTMPRQADESEVFIEQIFRRYLRYFVKNSPIPTTISYTAAGIPDTATEVMTSDSAQLAPAEDIKEMEFKVLTPLFYSRYARSPSCLHGTIAESQLLNSTIYLSDPQLSLTLAKGYIESAKSTSPPIFSSRWEKLSFDFLHYIRTEAGNIENCETKPGSKKDLAFLPPIKDTRRMSELERFILKACTPAERSEYVRRMGKIYLADHLGFGWPQILDLEIFTLKAGVLWFTVKTLL
ncbi:hypothetical protein LSUE1_G010076 [Lachnellula suecica]|uniref:Uncharacterized protein n=1 Tax=Lachnellula suecica TaxID=602035 RepID=A0A8T9BSS2_9HELO|nr:hypothetical protein LSUE1_G010076 [Lachnellula suecica]